MAQVPHVGRRNEPKRPGSSCSRKFPFCVGRLVRHPGRLVSTGPVHSVLARVKRAGGQKKVDGTLGRRSSPYANRMWSVRWAVASSFSRNRP